MKTVEVELTFDDVNVLIDELETEFGEERILPAVELPQDCSGGCTDHSSCCGTSRTQ